MWRGHNMTPPRYLGNPKPIHFDRHGTDVYGNSYEIRGPQPVIPTPKEVTMSGAIWCDFDDPDTNATGQIGHSFSAKDEEKQHFTKTRTVNVDTGDSFGRRTYQERQEITEEIDICGMHANGRAFAKKVIEAPKEPSLDDLEREDDDYRRGYEAAMEKVLTGERAE